jgi:hypothetical protein
MGSCLIASWHFLFQVDAERAILEAVFLFELIVSGGYVYLLLTFSI